MAKFAVICNNDFPNKIEYFVAENVNDEEFIYNLNEESVKRIMNDSCPRIHGEVCRAKNKDLSAVPAFEVIFKTDDEIIAYGVKAKLELEAGRIMDKLEALDFDIAEINRTGKFNEEFEKEQGNVGKYLVYLFDDGHMHIPDDEWEEGLGKIVGESEDFLILDGNKTIFKNRASYTFKILETEEEAEKEYEKVKDSLAGYDYDFNELFREAFSEELSE